MIKDIRNYSLLRHNTFCIDVKCRRFIEFTTTDEARHVVEMLSDDDTPLLLLGGGSNLLFTADYDRTVLHSAIKGCSHVEEDGTILLRCGSGETWDDVVAMCVRNGWHGMENLSLIPGEVGASAVQNIGAYGAEAKDVIDTVEVVEIATGEVFTFSNVDCQYAYRQSRFKHEWRGRFIVTHVTYRLSTRFTPDLDYGNVRAELDRDGISQPTASQLRDVIIKIRRAKLPDPEVEGNAGSFFMNPVVNRKKYEELAARYVNMPHYVIDNDHIKIPAGWMIDQCGWKGRTLGRAGVHSKQALVLVNRGGATGKDIVNLCEAIRHDVNERFGINICPEVNIF